MGGDLLQSFVQVKLHLCGTRRRRSSKPSEGRSRGGTSGWVLSRTRSKVSPDSPKATEMGRIIRTRMLFLLA